MPLLLLLLLLLLPLSPLLGTGATGSATGIGAKTTGTSWVTGGGTLWGWAATGGSGWRLGGVLQCPFWWRWSLSLVLKPEDGEREREKGGEHISTINYDSTTVVS